MNHKSALYIGIVALIAAVILVVVSLFIMRSSIRQRTVPASVSQAPAIVATPMITALVMSRSVDVTGHATDITKTFSARNDKVIYAVLTLKNVTSKTQIGYTRYLNGVYIDSKVAYPTTNADTFYFAFEKGVGKYPKGTYSIYAYVNGKRALKTSYSFKK